jgi:hypothetical protein
MNRVTLRTMAHVRRKVKRMNIVQSATQTAVYSVIPATLNDTVVHHVPLTLKEVATVTTDTVILGAMRIAIETFIHL